MFATLLLLLSCTPTDSAIADARRVLESALASGDVSAISDAARSAGALEGRDPALDRLLGDALANHLLKAEDGALLLRNNPAPDDPVWVAAATDAALRVGDRPWLHELLVAQGLELDLEHPVVAQVERLAAREADVDHKVLTQVVRDCTLVDGRPKLGRRQVDLPVPDNLERALRLLGATELIAARTTLVYSPRSFHERSWKCQAGWLPATSYTSIPVPLPPRGVVVVVSDGVTTGYVELERSDLGPWASVSGDPDMAARWLQAGSLLDDLGSDPDADARMLARYGTGLALPAAAEPGG